MKKKEEVENYERDHLLDEFKALYNERTKEIIEAKLKTQKYFHQAAGFLVATFLYALISYMAN